MRKRIELEREREETRLRNKETAQNRDMKKLGAHILAPEFWLKKQNMRINDRCKFIASKFELATQLKTRPGVIHPRLAEIIENHHSGEEPLNQNIVGQVFNLTIRDDKTSNNVNDGTWRLKVTDYDPFANEFELDSTGFDICPISKAYFRWPNINLNDELRKGYLKFVDKENALEMDHDISEASRRLFDTNVVGKTIEIKENRRFRKCKVLKYSDTEKIHTVSPEAGTGGSDLPRRMDLNALALKGQIRTAESLIPREVAQRWLAIAGGFRPNRGGIQGQRSDTLVAWPMPKGGNHEIN